MASTNKTKNLKLTQYISTDKPSWLTDYNNDMKTLDTAVAASGVHPAAVSKVGNLHKLTYTGDGDMVKFVAVYDFKAGDKLQLNTAEIPVLDCDGNAVKDTAWKTGDTVVLSLGKNNVRVISPLLNKANIGVHSAMLPLRDGYSGEIKYYYGDSNVVVASYNITRSSGGPFTSGTQGIAAFPAEVCPRSNVYQAPATTFLSDDKLGASTASMYIRGEKDATPGLIVAQLPTGVYQLRGNMCFCVE